MGECFPKTSLEQVKTLSDIVGGMYFFFIYLFISKNIISIIPFIQLKLLFLGRVKDL